MRVSIEKCKGRGRELVITQKCAAEARRKTASRENQALWWSGENFPGCPCFQVSLHHIMERKFTLENAGKIICHASDAPDEAEKCRSRKKGNNNIHRERFEILNREMPFLT